MLKCDSFCSASFGKKSNSERRVVTGEWSGGDDDTDDDLGLLLHILSFYSVHHL